MLGCRIIQSWDTAAKNGAQNDWSVCTTWLVVDRTYYLLALVRGRFSILPPADTALELAKRFKPDEILVEEASTGIALAQELRDEGDCFVNSIKINHDKIGRLFVQTGKFADRHSVLAAELDVVAMRRFAVLVEEDQLVLGAPRRGFLASSPRGVEAQRP